MERSPLAPCEAKDQVQNYIIGMQMSQQSCNILPVVLNELHQYLLNHNVYLKEPSVYSSYGERSFAMAGPKLWNQLPNNIKHGSDIASFKYVL